MKRGELKETFYAASIARYIKTKHKKKVFLFDFFLF